MDLNNRRIIFAGDSVTDCGWRDDVAALGNGYVRVLAKDPRLATSTVLNAGTGGNRIDDLAARWQQDVVHQAPDVVSVLIGVNDTWRHFDSGEETTARHFSAVYRRLLQQLPAETQIVLVDPFVIPVDHGQKRWRADLEAKIDTVHQISREFDAILVSADRRLNQLAQSVPVQELAYDGVHLSPRGHSELAAAWLHATEAA